MRLTILYGTETGTAQEVAENIAFAACTCGSVECTVLAADALPVHQWAEHSPVILVCSTTGQGDAPQTFQESWESLRAVDAPSMEGLQYAIFGLGDSSYTKFNVMAKMVHNRLLQLGGSPLVPRGLGDDEDAGGYAEELNKWAPKLWESLGLLGAPSTISGASVLLKYEIEALADQKGVQIEGRGGHGSSCRVLTNQRLTAVDHFQTVHHIELEATLTPLHALSVIGVWPKNDQSMVERMSKACNMSVEDVVRVRYRSGRFSSIDSRDAQFIDTAMTVGDLLSIYFDLEAVATRSFLRALAMIAVDEEERERLIELSADDRLIEYTDYAYREKRNCVEVLEDFSSCKVSLDIVICFMKKLQPRYFSISSSPTNDRGIMSLTVAKLEFTTPMHRKREGICSKQLCEAVPGDVLQCCIKEGTRSVFIPPETALLLIGPGTGIAPLRALAREHPSNKIVLYRGCRFHDKDNLYSMEWDSCEREHPLTFRQHLAVSRENRPLRYVHHVMAQESNAREIASLICEGAIIFVCGNSKQMPKDVERTLVSIVEVLIPTQSTTLLKMLKKEGRLFFDTWS